VAIMWTMPELDRVLAYELVQAKRHRRYVTVAMIQTEPTVDQWAALGGSVRESDAYFTSEQSFGAVLMSETDQSGAMVAIDRYKAAAGASGRMWFALGCYPEDGANAESVLRETRKRLSQSAEMEPGTVVAS
jgi:hypothetical protein